MSETIQVPSWEYQDKNINGGIEQADFTRADRVMLYASPTPLPGQQSSTMSAVGLVQGMSHSENKQLQMLFELGSAAPMIVPGLTQGQISIQRVLINGMNLLNTLYHGDATNLNENQILRSIRDVNRPFDLMVAKYPVLDDTPSASAVETTLFRGCQIQTRNENVTAGGVVIMEQMNIMYQYIPKVTFRAA